MFEQDVVKPGFIFGYILSLLALSWGVTGLAFAGILPASGIAIIAFLPGILAFLFLSFEDHPIEVHARPLLGPVRAPAVILAVAYPFLLLGLAAFVALGTGLGYLNTGTGPGIAALAAGFLLAIPASLVQEYGYRGYLLPSLTYWEGRFPATLWAGVLWGLAMAPASYLVLAGAGTADPLSIAALGFILTAAVAFAFSACYYLSESILPVTLMNALLTVAMPAVFAATWNPVGAAPGGIIGVTWPSPVPLILLIALAFVPVFAWFFSAMDGEVGGDAL